MTPWSHSAVSVGGFAGACACARLKLSRIGRSCLIRSMFAKRAMRERSSSVRRFMFSMSATARLPSSVICSSFCSVSLSLSSRSSGSEGSFAGFLSLGM